MYPRAKNAEACSVCISTTDPQLDVSAVLEMIRWTNGRERVKPLSVSVYEPRIPHDQPPASKS